MVTRITELSSAAREIGAGNLIYLSILVQKTKWANSRVSSTTWSTIFAKNCTCKICFQTHRADDQRTQRLDFKTRRRRTPLCCNSLSDIRNFTTVAEKLEPEQIVKLINIYFHLQTEMIEKNGGIVDKFMGDQVMAIFPTQNMLPSAIAAAVAIQRGIREVNRKRKQQGEVILEVGIGINHGPAVLGNMGHKLRMDYTVIGDVVNIAARLCGIAKAGQIIASMEAVKTWTANIQQPACNRLL